MVSISVCVGGRARTVKITEDASVEDLLGKLEINPETVVVLKNKEVVPDFETVSAKDRIEIINIVSGG